MMLIADDDDDGGCGNDNYDLYNGNIHSCVWNEFIQAFLWPKHSFITSDEVFSIIFQ